MGGRNQRSFKMIAEIRQETQKAIELLKKSKISLRKQGLILQLTEEINKLMDAGEWDFAVRLAYYRHEFAKCANNLDWYPPFLEIRKTRDKIKILTGTPPNG